MFDTPNYTPAQLQSMRRFFHGMNHFMVFMWKLGMGRLMNCWPAGFGRIMVIRHIGRKSGREYLTPVNYAPFGNEIYCAAGFGPGTDWYRNVLSKGEVELWLPEGWRRASACDASTSPDRTRLLRAVAVASGFAGPLLGVDPRKMSDEQLEKAARDYRLVHFTVES